MRSKMTVWYRTDAGLIDVDIDLDELVEVDPLIEAGPSFYAIDRIEVLVRCVRLPHAWVDDPSYKTEGSAGMDLYATAQVMIYPGKTQIIPTGIQLAIPEGYEGQIRPRSGLAAMHQLTVLNAPGTIDSDYRGEVAVILINHGIIPKRIERGDRIAQIVFAPVVRATLDHVTTLDDTTRGEGGFGSTGT